MDMLFLASSVGGPLKAFVDSDLCGRLIVIIQIGMSIISWSVMAGRLMHLNDLSQRSKRFVDDLLHQNDPLALFYNGYSFSTTPMEEVYQKSCERLADLIPERQRLALRNDPDAYLSIDHYSMDLVEATCAHTTDEETVELSKGMTILSIITSCAPLLGLFGTVWGVMLAFQAMAASGTADIAQLAPGISSALLTTVVGLVVAIPSTIFYSALQTKIDSFTVQLEGFSEELMGKLTQKYLERERR